MCSLSVLTDAEEQVTVVPWDTIVCPIWIVLISLNQSSIWISNALWNSYCADVLALPHLHTHKFSVVRCTSEMISLLLSHCNEQPDFEALYMQSMAALYHTFIIRYYTVLFIQLSNDGIDTKKSM